MMVVFRADLPIGEKVDSTFFFFTSCHLTTVNKRGLTSYECLFVLTLADYRLQSDASSSARRS